MADIQKIIEYKITGNPSEFNKVMDQIEKTAQKEPIQLRFDVDLGEIKGQLGQIKTLINNVSKDGKIKIYGLGPINTQLIQIDETLGRLTEHFTGLRRSIDISSELNENKRSLENYQKQFQNVIENANKIKPRKSTDDFFGIKSVKKDIRDIMSGSDFSFIYDENTRNMSRLLVEIAKASQEQDGLTKSIQISDTEAVTLKDIFDKITSSIQNTGKSLSELKITGLSAEIISVLGNIQKIEDSIPNLQEKLDDAISREKAGSINVEISSESIKELADTIGQLKAVLTQGEESGEITLGLTPDQVEKITNSFKGFQEVLENIHTLLSSFDIPKIKLPEIETNAQEPRQENRQVTTRSTTVPNINGGTTTVTHTNESSMTSGGTSGVDTQVDGQNRLQQELRETRQEITSTNEAISNIGSQAKPNEQESVAQYIKKSDYEIYESGMELAKNREMLFQNIFQKETEIANKSSDEVKSIYTNMAGYTAKLYNDKAKDGDYSIDDKINETKTMMISLQEQIETETDPVILSSLNEQLDETKIKLIALVETFKESASRVHAYSSDALSPGSQAMDEYSRKYRQDYTIGDNHFNIAQDDKQYWDNLTKGIQTEHDLTEAIEQRKQALVELEEKRSAAEEKALSLDIHSSEYKTAFQEQMDITNQYNEARQDLYNLMQLQKNWGKSIQDASQINSYFLPTEFKDEEQAFDAIDDAINRIIEDKKKLEETAVVPTEPTIKQDNRSLEEKLELLKSIKNEYKFLDTAEDRRIDMEEKAWDVGGNKPKSQADSDKKISAYEDHIKHMEDAEKATDEFQDAYQKLIITLKNGEKIELTDFVDLADTSLDKRRIKDIQFIPNLEDKSLNDLVTFLGELKTSASSSEDVIHEVTDAIRDLLDLDPNKFESFVKILARLNSDNPLLTDGSTDIQQTVEALEKLSGIEQTQDSPIDTVLDKKVAELQYLHDKVRTIFDGKDGIINEDMSYSEKFDSSEVQRMITLLSQLSDAELKATMGIEGDDWTNEFRSNLQSEINRIKELQDEIQQVYASTSGVNEAGLDVGELDIIINDRLEEIYETAQNVTSSFNSSLTPSVKEFLLLIEDNLGINSMSEFMTNNAQEIDRYVNDIIHNGKSVKEVFADMENHYGWDTARFDNLIDGNVPTELKGLYDSLFSDVENRIKSAEQAADEFNAKLREFQSSVDQSPISSGTTALPEQEREAGLAGQQMGEQIADGMSQATESVNAYREALNKSFDTRNKRDATSQLRAAYNEYQKYFGENGSEVDKIVREQSDEARIAAYNYSEAYKEALKKEISDSNFSRYRISDFKKYTTAEDVDYTFSDVREYMQEQARILEELGNPKLSKAGLDALNEYMEQWDVLRARKSSEFYMEDGVLDQSALQADINYLQMLKESLKDVVKLSNTTSNETPVSTSEEEAATTAAAAHEKAAAAAEEHAAAAHQANEQEAQQPIQPDTTNTEAQANANEREAETARDAAKAETERAAAAQDANNNTTIPPTASASSNITEESSTVDGLTDAIDGVTRDEVISSEISKINELETALTGVGESIGALDDFFKALGENSAFSKTFESIKENEDAIKSFSQILKTTNEQQEEAIKNANLATDQIKEEKPIDPSKWKEYLSGYDDLIEKLGDVVDIREQIRVSEKDGQKYVSYQIKGKNGSAIIGKNGRLLRSTSDYDMGLKQQQQEEKERDKQNQDALDKELLYLDQQEELYQRERQLALERGKRDAEYQRNQASQESQQRQDYEHFWSDALDQQDQDALEKELLYLDQQEEIYQRERALALERGKRDEEYNNQQKNDKQKSRKDYETFWENTLNQQDIDNDKKLQDFYDEQIKKINELYEAKSKMNEMNAKAAENPEVKGTVAWADAVERLRQAYIDASVARKELDVIKEDITDEQYNSAIDKWTKAQSGSKESQEKVAVARNKSAQNAITKEYNDQISIINKATEAMNKYNEMRKDELIGKSFSGDKEKASIISAVEETSKAADEAIAKLKEMQEQGKISMKLFNDAQAKYNESEIGSNAQKIEQELNKGIASHDQKLESEWLKAEASAIKEAQDAIEKYYNACQKVEDLQNRLSTGENVGSQLLKPVNDMQNLQGDAQKSMGVLQQLSDSGSTSITDSIIKQQKDKLDEANQIMNTFKFDDDNAGFENINRGYQTLIKNAERYAQILEKQRTGQTLTFNELSFLQKYGQYYQDAADGAGLFADAQNKVNASLKQQFDQSMSIANDNVIVKQYNDISNELNKLGQQTWNDEGNQKLDELRKKYLDVAQAVSQLKTATDEQKKSIKQSLDSLFSETSNFKTDKDLYTKADNTSVAVMNRKMSEWIHNNSAAVDFIPQVKQLQSSLDGISVDGLSKVSAEFENIKARAAEAGQTGLSFGDALKKSFGGLARYLATYTSFYRVIGTIKQGFNVVKEFDDALTEMRKVSDEPVSTLKSFQEESFGMANSIGTTAVQIQKSTADWMRLGESIDKAKESAKDATILLNVSEFSNIDDATKSLVSMSQAYQDLDKIDIIDKLNNIGNNFSISTDQLATGLQNAAAVLKTQGNDIDKAIALLTAGNAITQDVSKTSAGIRTIALRISGTEEAKDEIKDLGEDVDDFVVRTRSKTDQIIRDYTAVASNAYQGVSVLDENGNLRDTYSILLDIAKIYSEIKEEDKEKGTNRAQALVETLAGKNRSNIAASILENPQLLEDVYNASLDSAGSAMQENEKYLDSISGKIQLLKNEIQELATLTFDSDWLKIMIDLATKAVKAFNGLSKSVGGFNAVVGSIVGIFLQKNGKGKSRSKKCPLYIT